MCLSPSRRVGLSRRHLPSFAPLSRRLGGFAHRLPHDPAAASAVLALVDQSQPIDDPPLLLVEVDADGVGVTPPLAPVQFLEDIAELIHCFSPWGSVWDG